jgi:hypothetical protein
VYCIFQRKKETASSTNKKLQKPQTNCTPHTRLFNHTHSSVRLGRHHPHKSSEGRKKDRKKERKGKQGRKKQQLYTASTREQPLGKRPGEEN